MQPVRLRLQNAFSYCLWLVLILLTLTLVCTNFAYGQSELVSDDFRTSSLDTELWTIVDPLGDSTVTVTGTQLSITVPAGTSHDVWSDGNLVPQVQQAVNDTNFEAIAKFESMVSAKYQQQGFLIQADDDDLVRLEIQSTGRQTRVFAATFLDGVPTTRILKNIKVGVPHYLRVTRFADQWTLAYSANGTNWTTAGSFTHVLSVRTLGLYAGNSGGATAHTAVIDYLLNTSSPISPEDEGSLAGPYTLTVQVEGNGSVRRDPDAASYPPDTDVTLIAVPTEDSQFQEWRGAVWSDSPSVTIPVTGDLEVIAAFSASQDAVPPVISSVNVRVADTTATVSWTTDEAATGTVAYGETKSYELGRESEGGLITTHIITLSGLQPGMTYHYEVTSGDRAGNARHTTDATFTTTAGPNAPPVIHVWYGPDQTFGHIGHSQPWINVLGRASDPDGIATLSYSLNGGPQQPLSIGPDGRRLAMSGDFNVEIDRIDLNDGMNPVVITATDNTGAANTTTIDIDFSSPNTWPTMYSIHWDSVRNIQDVVDVVDGQWRLVPSGIRTAQVGYDRLLAIGDIAWDYYEITVPVTIHAVHANPSFHGYGVGIQFGWAGHTNRPVTCAQLHCGWLPSGPTAWWFEGEVRLGSQVGSAIDLQLGVRYYWKFRVHESRGKPFYSFKVWQDGMSEPDAWNLRSSKPNILNGSLLLVGHNADVTFGDVTIRPTGNR